MLKCPTYRTDLAQLTVILGGVGLSLSLGAFLVYVFAQGRGLDRQVVPLLWIPAMLPLLLAVKLHLQFLKRMWTAIGQSTPLVSPSWVLDAHYGWVKAYQRHLLQQEVEGPPVSARLALVFAGLLTLSALPVVGIPIAAFSLLFQGVFLFQAVRALHFLDQASRTSG